MNDTKLGSRNTYTVVIVTEEFVVDLGSGLSWEK